MFNTSRPDKNSANPQTERAHPQGLVAKKITQLVIVAKAVVKSAEETMAAYDSPAIQAARELILPSSRSQEHKLPMADFSSVTRAPAKGVDKPLSAAEVVQARRLIYGPSAPTGKATPAEAKNLQRILVSFQYSLETLHFIEHGAKMGRPSAALIDAARRFLAAMPPAHQTGPVDVVEWARLKSKALNLHSSMDAWASVRMPFTFHEVASPCAVTLPSARAAAVRIDSNGATQPLMPLYERTRARLITAYVQAMESGYVYLADRCACRVNELDNAVAAIASAPQVTPADVQILAEDLRRSSGTLPTFAWLPGEHEAPMTDAVAALFATWHGSTPEHANRHANRDLQALRDELRTIALEGLNVAQVEPGGVAERAAQLLAELAYPPTRDDPVAVNAFAEAVVAARLFATAPDAKPYDPGY